MVFFLGETSVHQGIDLFFI